MLASLAWAGLAFLTALAPFVGLAALARFLALPVQLLYRVALSVCGETWRVRPLFVDRRKTAARGRFKGLPALPSEINTARNPLLCPGGASGHHPERSPAVLCPLAGTDPSVPVLTFVRYRGGHFYECQNQRDTSNYMI